MIEPERVEHWCSRLRQFQEKAQSANPVVVEGKLTRIVRLTLEAVQLIPANDYRFLQLFLHQYPMLAKLLENIGQAA